MPDLHAKYKTLNHNTLNDTLQQQIQISNTTLNMTQKNPYDSLTQPMTPQHYIMIPHNYDSHTQHMTLEHYM